MYSSLHDICFLLCTGCVSSLAEYVFLTIHGICFLLCRVCVSYYARYLFLTIQSVYLFYYAQCVLFTMHTVCFLLCTVYVVIDWYKFFNNSRSEKNISERNYKKVAYIPFYNNQAMQLANNFAGRKETVVSVSAIVNFSHLYKC